MDLRHNAPYIVLALCMLDDTRHESTCFARSCVCERLATLDRFIREFALASSSCKDAESDAAFKVDFYVDRRPTWRRRYSTQRSIYLRELFPRHRSRIDPNDVASNPSEER